VHCFDNSLDANSLFEKIRSNKPSNVSEYIFGNFDHRKVKLEES